MPRIFPLLFLFTILNHNLKKCIESIINQTFRNIEIILVDDGSTDTSAEILADYALRDNRIIVIHQRESRTFRGKKCRYAKRKRRIYHVCR